MTCSVVKPATQFLSPRNAHHNAVKIVVRKNPSDPISRQKREVCLSSFGSGMDINFASSSSFFISSSSWIVVPILPLQMSLPRKKEETNNMHIIHIYTYQVSFKTQGGLPSSPQNASYHFLMIFPQRLCHRVLATFFPLVLPFLHFDLCRLQIVQLRHSCQSVIGDRGMAMILLLKLYGSIKYKMIVDWKSMMEKT